MEISECVRAELDKLYIPKLAACRWAEHVPMLLAQEAALEDMILRVLERMNTDE
jgi:hypothetical protein